MALYIDLFQEIKEQAQQRRRDPVRGGILVSLLIGLCVAGYYMLSLSLLSSLNNEKSRLAQKWAELEPRANQAKKDADRINNDILLVKTLGERSESRFCWATVLGRMIQIVPDKVELTQISCSTTPGVSPGYDISIAGYVSGDDPRARAEEIRIAAGKEFPQEYQVTSVFKNLEDVKMPDDTRRAAFTIAVEAKKPEKEKRKRETPK